MKVKRILLAVLWALALASISFYGGTISYGFFFGITLIPVISGLYLLYVYFKFLVYQVADVKHVVCGQPIPYYFVFQNDDFVAYMGVSVRLFSDFSYVERVPDEAAYELLPGDKFRYDTRLTCKYRGEYHVGVKEIIITDLFCLFQVRYRIPYPIKAMVTPKIVKLNELKSIPEVSAFLQSNALHLATETDAVVRDYAAGDTLNKIHWKATAREQKLKVRRMLGEEKTGIAILCDTKRVKEKEIEYLPSENKILETVLAVSYFFAEKNTKLKLLYEKNGTKMSTVDGIWCFDSFYHEISEMWFEKGNEISFLLQEVLEKGLVTDCKAVFMVLHEINDILIEKAASMAAGGMAVILYVITNRDISAYLKRSNTRMKITAISPEEELEGIL